MQSLSIGVKGISDAPELTNDAIEHARWNPEIGCLIDRVQPGVPLILCFGFVNWKKLPIFDFFGRTKKLEIRMDQPLNRILVRDIENSWYHRGVPGLGAHVEEVAASLRGLIRSIRPSCVWTIGQSMGGYAATMFGMLLNADRIVAFGPLSFLDPEKALLYGERRFLPVMNRLAADRPKSYFDDLVRLGTSLNYQGALNVVFGTHPGGEATELGNLDAIHALRLARLANVSLYPHPQSDHLVVKWLSDNQLMDGLLDKILLGEPQPGLRGMDPR
jgi:pimeloyl-ACP methyl ester carboxylesterase